jgi:cobalt-precorrin-5B (C1)-methyltransferase
MNDLGKRSGFTLPVFAIASAKAALLALQDRNASNGNLIVDINLPDGNDIKIEISQCTCLDAKTALAITISDPGDNLDLTAGTPVWAWVQLQEWQGEHLILEAGEGVGHNASGYPAIYKFANTLAEINLLPLLRNIDCVSKENGEDIPLDKITARVRFILPEGRSLAERTSNAAFGILEGLALLGTSAFSQPLSAEEKLEDFRTDLRQKAKQSQDLAFCIGANGDRVAIDLGFERSRIVQTSNWIGAMLVEAALLDVKKISLIGYHGKLLKLAGGIFNTSSHLADARIEILTAAAVNENLPMELTQEILRSPTAESVHKLLVQHGYDRVVFSYLTQRINHRAIAYIRKYTEREIRVETILCDRLSQIIPVDLVPSMPGA